MTGPRAPGLPPLSRARRGPGIPWLALAVASLAAPPHALARDLQLRADVTDAQDRTNDTTSDYLRQFYAVDWRRQFSRPLSWRLSLQVQDDRGETVAGDVHTDLRTRILTPAASLDYRIDELGLIGSWRRTDERRIDPATGGSANRVIERTSAVLVVHPFVGADGTVAADRLAFSSASMDTTDDRFGVNFRYSSPHLTLTNENRLQHYLDARADVSRISIGPRVVATYARSFGERFQLATLYRLDYLRTERTAKSAGTVPVDLEPVAGLVAVDALPDETPPMSPEPRLVDLEFDVPAGVSLGPRAPLYQNLAVDLGRVATADELRVHARNGSLDPVPFGESVTWSVYSSQDGLRWAWEEGAAARFDTTLSAWVITFPVPVTARHLKAVNLGVNTVETYVTELQAFAYEDFLADETRVSSAVRQTLGVTARARPWPKVELGWTGQVNANAVTPEAGETAWSTDVGNSLVVTLGPWDTLRYGAAGAQTWSRQADGRSQANEGATVHAHWQPIEAFGGKVEARVAADQLYPATGEPVRALTWGAGAGVDARFFPTARLFVSGSVNRQMLGDGGTTDYVSATGQAQATVVRDLTFQISSSMQRTLESRGDTSAQRDTPTLRILTYQSHVAEASWRPSGQLTLIARAGYSESPNGSGLVQSYRANWSPFPGGAVQLAFDFSEEIDPITGQSFRRASASPRWDLNRHAALQLSYNMARGSGAVSVEQQNLYLTFSLRQ